jgi:lipopolysaccharide assembly outer membrane protein LptD (OstA)
VVAPSLTFTDPKGTVVWKLKAEAATVAPEEVAQGQAYRGGLRNGTVTLYQQGKPAATLKAKIVRADQATRTVVGEGDVVVRSLASPDAPAIRADTMTWRYDADQITGHGNVLVTREPDMRVPGDRFTADTAVRRFRLYNGSGGSASGSF